MPHPAQWQLRRATGRLLAETMIAPPMLPHFQAVQTVRVLSAEVLDWSRRIRVWRYRFAVIDFR
jgi:hypothetical protein